MASSSGRKSGSSGRSTGRKRVVIGAEETVRVRYGNNKPQVEAERRKSRRQAAALPAHARQGTGRSVEAGRRIASAKRDERDRRKRDMRRRRTVTYIVFAALIAGVVWGTASLVRMPGLRIRDVTVIGASRLEAGRIRTLAAIPSDSSILTVDTDAIRSRVLKEPWVASVTVKRDFPDGVTISVKERRAAAIVDAGGSKMFLVSSDGHWLGERSAEDTMALCSIRDIETLDPKPGAKTRSKELQNALKVLDGMSPELLSEVKVISAASVDKTALLTDKDVEIFIGEAQDLDKKDRIAREILQREKGKVVYINVRVVERPTWRGLDDGE